MKGNIDMGRNKIIELQKPVNNDDAVNKKYTDDEIAKVSLLTKSKLSFTGGSMHGEIDMNRNKIVRLPPPTSDDDAANKKYVDSKVTSSGRTKRDTDSDLDMKNYKIVNLATPTGGTDASNKKYVDDEVSTLGVNRVDIHGRNVMQADLNLNSYKIIDLAPPTGNLDAANKKYVDDSKSITSDLNVNKHKVVNLATPTSNYDAATKLYVDTEVLVSNVGKLDIHGKAIMQANLNLDQYKIINLRTPTANGDAANKKYVDDNAGLKSVTTDFNVNSHKIINLSTPTSNSDAATKKYVDDSKGAVIGSGSLNMNKNKIINLADPTSNKDAVTKDYVDAGVQSKLSHVYGGIMTGPIDMYGNSILNLPTPAGDTFAATKKYVDDRALEDGSVTMDKLSNSLKSEISTDHKKIYQCIGNDDQPLTYKFVSKDLVPIGVQDMAVISEYVGYVGSVSAKVSTALRFITNKAKANKNNFFKYKEEEFFAAEGLEIPSSAVWKDLFAKFLNTSGSQFYQSGYAKGDTIRYLLKLLTGEQKHYVGYAKKGSGTTQWGMVRHDDASGNFTNQGAQVDRFKFFGRAAIKVDSDTIYYNNNNHSITHNIIPTMSTMIIMKVCTTIDKFSWTNFDTSLIYSYEVADTNKIVKMIDLSEAAILAVIKPDNSSATREWSGLRNLYCANLNGNVYFNFPLGTELPYNHTFITYKIKSFLPNPTTNWSYGAVFGNRKISPRHKNKTFTSVIPRGNNLLHIVTPIRDDKVTLTSFKSEANPCETGKWISLSLHLNYGEFSIWCNGIKLSTVKSNAPHDTSGTYSSTSIGSERSEGTNAGSYFNGHIGRYVHYRMTATKLTDRDILEHHYYLMTTYGINTSYIEDDF